MIYRVGVTGFICIYLIMINDCISFVFGSIELWWVNCDFVVYASGYENTVYASGYENTKQFSSLKKDDNSVNWL